MVSVQVDEPNEIKVGEAGASLSEPQKRATACVNQDA